MKENNKISMYSQVPELLPLPYFQVHMKLSRVRGAFQGTEPLTICLMFIEKL